MAGITSSVRMLYMLNIEQSLPEPTLGALLVQPRRALESSKNANKTISIKNDKNLEASTSLILIEVHL